jgi:hypothetical protein
MKMWIQAQSRHHICNSNNRKCGFRLSHGITFAIVIISRIELQMEIQAWSRHHMEVVISIYETWCKSGSCFDGPNATDFHHRIVHLWLWWATLWNKERCGRHEKMRDPLSLSLPLCTVMPPLHCSPLLEHLADESRSSDARPGGCHVDYCAPRATNQ